MPAGQDLYEAKKAAPCNIAVDLRQVQAGLHASPFVDVTGAILPPANSPNMTALLDLCMASSFATVILSGAHHGADVQHLDIMLQVAEARAGVAAGATRIIAMAGDNPHGLLAAASFAGKSKRLIALGWDAGALAAAMGSGNGLGVDVAGNARATLLLAAAAANVAAIDTIEPDTNDETLLAICLHAKAQGFSGKVTGTRSQVPVIRSVFSD